MDRGPGTETLRGRRKDCCRQGEHAQDERMAENSSSKVHGYRGLMVWRRSIELAAECHRLSSGWAGRDRFGITSQVRRAASSVHANIAEGNGRFHRREYIHFLGIANGSLRETESHLLLASELGLCEAHEMAKALDLIDETGKMLISLARRLRGEPLKASRSQSDP